MANKGDMGWRILAGVSAFAGGWIARKAITTGWKKTTGKEPPTNPESPDVALTVAIGGAILVGVGVVRARLLATRAAAQQWARHTGELPMNLRADS
jgi:hypothetical protein